MTTTAILSMIKKSYWIFESISREILVKSKYHIQPSKKIESNYEVTLTSYPPRFNKLQLTVKSLLLQSTRAKKITLWIAKEDKAKLPKQLLKLQSDYFSIRFCEDIKSYKKIIPTLRETQSRNIITADDDVYYPPTWLERLIATHKLHPNNVICSRGHRISFQDGIPKPYSQWEFGVSENTGVIFPTGIGGVLYPKYCFHPDILKDELFLKLCPNADDVWLFWMARLNGYSATLTDPILKPINWIGSQEISLLKENVLESKNDLRIRDMINAYGMPD